MRHIEVKFQNDTHAFVDDYLLETLIRSGQIKQFYRPSEHRWITIGIDLIRNSPCGYRRTERRRSGHSTEMIPRPVEKELAKRFTP
jgi:hypothetical protein